MKNIFRSFWNDRAGNTGMLFGIVLIPVVFGAGSALDYTRAAKARTNMQALADGGALAALASSDTSVQGRTAAAMAFFPTDDAHADPNLVAKPSVSVSIVNNDVTVTATASVRTAILGVAMISQIPVRVTATTTFANNGPPICILALNPTASGAVSFSGNTTVTAQKCAVFSNSSDPSAVSIGGNASVTAAGFCAVGGVSAPPGTTPAPMNHCRSVADPFSNLPATAAGGCNNTNLSIAPNTIRALIPGTYCGGLDMRGIVTLMPGLYVISGPLSISSQATVTGSGVTFYLVGPSAGFTISGGGNINISAMTTGPYAGIAIIQDRASNPGVTDTLNGNSGTIIEGAIYVPTQKVTVTGTGTFGQTDPFMPIVADQISFTGNSTVTIEDTNAMQTVNPLAKFPSPVLKS